MKQKFALPFIIFCVLAASVTPNFSRIQANAGDPIPSEYQTVYTGTQTNLNNFEKTLNSSWTGDSSYPTNYSADLLFANSENGTAMFNTYYYSYNVTPMLNYFQNDLGVNMVKVSLNLPVFDQYYWNNTAYGNNPTAYNNFLTFYKKLVADIHSRGMKLLIDTQTIQTQNYAQGLGSYPNLLSYYESIPFAPPAGGGDSYEGDRATQALVIAQQIKPDYLSLQDEPLTEYGAAKFSQLNNASEDTQMVQFILNTIDAANAHTGIIIGAGIGTWQSSAMTWINDLTAINNLDMIGIHVYPVNVNGSVDYLHLILDISNAAHSAGKKVGITEAWLYPETNSELTTLSEDSSQARSSYSFWSPLDQQFINELVKAAKYEDMEMVDFFWSIHFLAYLNYYNVSGCAVPPENTCSNYQIETLAQNAADAALPNDTLTDTGAAYHQYLQSNYLFPDVTAPNTPAGLSVSALSTASMKLTWNPATDVSRTGYVTSGIANYAVYRNGTQIGTTATPTYTDTGLTTATTYSYAIQAVDAAGNISAESTAINGETATTGSTPPADTQPPTVSITLPLSNATISGTTILTATASDNAAVASVQFQVDGTAVGSPITTAPYTYNLNTSTLSNSTHIITALAKDTSNNIAVSSAVPIVVSNINAVGPSVPSGLVVVNTDQTDDTFTWTASTDNAAITSYDIYRNGTQIGTALTPTFTDSGLSPATTYSYTVTAQDSTGNTSAPSSALSITTLAPVTSGGSGGSSGGSGSSISIPTPVTTPTPIPSESTSSEPIPSEPTVSSNPAPSGALPTGAHGNNTVINENGTFYLIKNNQLLGITDPGILNSYGYAFSDAVAASSADLAIPMGPLLAPNDGALVKTAQDPTVYLISGKQQHGFTSASVFLGQGFQWTSVLTVTAPELATLPQGAIISDPEAAHLKGVQINEGGTIYWVDVTTKDPYPSLEVYNSWNLNQDFSIVVPANAADDNIPVGPAVIARVSGS